VKESRRTLTERQEHAKSKGRPEEGPAVIPFLRSFRSGRGPTPAGPRLQSSAGGKVPLAPDRPRRRQIQAFLRIEVTAAAGCSGIAVTCARLRCGNTFVSRRAGAANGQLRARTGPLLHAGSSFSSVSAKGWRAYGSDDLHDELDPRRSRAIARVARVTSSSLATIAASWANRRLRPPEESRGAACRFGKRCAAEAADPCREGRGNGRAKLRPVTTPDAQPG